jgi:hypothetical protein
MRDSDCTGFGKESLEETKRRADAEPTPARFRRDADETRRAEAIRGATAVPGAGNRADDSGSHVTLVRMAIAHDQTRFDREARHGD